MNSRLPFFVALVLGLGLASADRALAQNITLGAKGGYTLSKPTDLEEASSKGGFALGAYLNFGLSENLFLGIEGLYAERKSAAPSESATDAEDQIKQAFLEVPAYIGGRLSAGMLQPKLYAGAMAAFETTCTLSVEGTGISESGDCSAEGLDTKSVNWSAIFGGGLDVALTAIILSADVRYNLGLTNLADEPEAQEKWNHWEFLLGVGFRLGN
jgi:hypothetical protein